MHGNTDDSLSLDALCDQLNDFCKENQLPLESADELLTRLYGEEPRRVRLCEWLQGFIERWDAACDAEHDAWLKQKDDAQ